MARWVGRAPVEGAEERVVVALADGVELVIVATGAGHGQPHERLRHHVHLVVRPLHPVFPRIHRLVAVLDEAVVRGRDDGLVQAAVRVEPGLGQQVAGQVLADELVVGHVGVERPDQVVAIAPRLRDVRVALAAVRLAVAYQVHPVTGPALAEVRRVEIAVDQGLVGVWRDIADEARDLGRRRREPAQVERQPADEGLAVGGTGRRHPLGVEPRSDEAVDGPNGPRRVGDIRRRHRADRLPGPVGAAAPVGGRTAPTDRACRRRRWRLRATARPSRPIRRARRSAPGPAPRSAASTPAVPGPAAPARSHRRHPAPARVRCRRQPATPHGCPAAIRRTAPRSERCGTDSSCRPAAAGWWSRKTRPARPWGPTPAGRRPGRRPKAPR